MDGLTQIHRYSGMEYSGNSSSVIGNPSSEAHGSESLYVLDSNRNHHTFVGLRVPFLEFSGYWQPGLFHWKLVRSGLDFCFIGVRSGLNQTAALGFYVDISSYGISRKRVRD